MPSITLQDLQKMQDERQPRNPIAVALLEVFEGDTPLQEEQLSDWMQIAKIEVAILKQAINDAIECGWIKVDEQGYMRLSAEGKAQAE
jgi:hypothetical protein